MDAIDARRVVDLDASRNRRDLSELASDDSPSHSTRLPAASPSRVPVCNNPELMIRPCTLQPSKPHYAKGPDLRPMGLHASVWLLCHACGTQGHSDLNSF